MSKVRTRFAPSPTGRMHVGNLRTALYAYLIARHEDGDFLLRIEDTDQNREMEGAVDIIKRTLSSAGLEYDEGPDKPGAVGPYVQSERVRAGIYMEHAKKLVHKGEAYYCFCTPERLSSLKTVVDEGGKEISVYDKHCLSLTPEQVQKNLDAGMSYCIRQNNPRDGVTTFHDDIYGEISVDNSELDDMILIKSDGFPTYNFANVVDDHLMGITHVVRGNEYLSSSPKYNRLYEAFGWEVPKYIHCPLITDEEHKKLSKRSGHSSFEDLTDQGFLPEAIVNFVALLGWSPEDNQEIMDLRELERRFDYRHISKSPAVFDYGKLKWMNSEYIKAMDPESFFVQAAPFIREALGEGGESAQDEGRLRKISALVQSRIEVFPDIREQVDFFGSLPEYDTSLYIHKKSKSDEASSCEILRELLPLLEAEEDYSSDGLYSLIMKYVEEKGIKNRLALWPLRVAVSGKPATPGGATEIMEILGKQESLSRISRGIEKLAQKLS